jgi:hypothetical protein
MPVEVGIKWNGKEFVINLEPTETVMELKHKLEGATSVLAKRQKVQSAPPSFAACPSVARLLPRTRRPVVHLSAGPLSAAWFPPHPLLSALSYFIIACPDLFLSCPVLL